MACFSISYYDYTYRKELSMNLSLKYWMKHRKQAFSVIITIALSMAALTCVAFLARSSSVSDMEEQLDYSGNYDIIVPDITNEKIEKIKSDDRFALSGVIYRGGIVKAVGDVSFVFGALKDESSQDLYHFSTTSGRYPKQSGEIAAYRRFFEMSGVAPELGNTVTLELIDNDGKIIGNKDYKIVGILDDERGTKIDRQLKMCQGYAFPQVFLSSDDMPQKTKYDLIATYTIGADINAIKKELSNDGITAYDGGRILMLTSISLAPIQELSEKALIEGLRYAQKDFYAYALIPIVTAVVLITAFISIISIMSSVLADRKRQLSLLRCIGMEKASALKMSIKETAVFVLSGTIIGFMIGVLVYIAILFIQSRFFGLKVYPAFNANEVIKAITVDPYITPAICCLLCSLLAIVLPYIQFIKSSPSQAFRQITTNRSTRMHRIKRKFFVLSRISTQQLESMFCLVIIIAVMWSSVFGYLYFISKSEHDNKQYEELASSSGLGDMDYVAKKNFISSTFGLAQSNMHYQGLSHSSLDNLSKNENIKTVIGCIEIPSTKLIYKKSRIPDDLKNALLPSNIDDNTIEEYKDYNKKLKNALGYHDDEIIYNIPTIAVSSDMLKELARYSISGEIDSNNITSNKSVLIWQTGSESVFKTNDMLTISEIVCDDTKIDGFDFSSGKIPDNTSPSFKYSYYNTILDGYAFGKRVDNNAKVGGIIKINDEHLSNFLSIQPLTGSSNYIILCSEDTLRSWKINNENYTKVGVELTEKANLKTFEKQWYLATANRFQSYESKSGLIRKMHDTTTVNMSVFFAIIAVIVLLGLIGIANSTSYRIRRKAKNLLIVRALGMTKFKLAVLIYRQNIILAAIGAATSIVPLFVFESFKQKALNFIHGEQIIIQAENGKYNIPWQTRFPVEIDLFSHNTILVIFLSFIIITLLIIISSLLPVRRISKMQLSSSLSEDI